MSRAEEAQHAWRFVTNHTQVLLCIAENPAIRLREVAAQVGITERAAQRIVADLVEAGYVIRERSGRRNQYTINRGREMRHPAQFGYEIGPLLDLLRRSSYSQLDLRRERAARNESAFRELNERKNELDDDHGAFTVFVCECEDEGCVEPVSLTTKEYEAIRANSNSFFVIPGHETPMVDQVIEKAESYLVVRKRGAGAEVAEELDPRTP
jgi:predicted transcriptional regulator